MSSFKNNVKYIITCGPFIPVTNKYLYSTYYVPGPAPKVRWRTKPLPWPGGAYFLEAGQGLAGFGAWFLQGACRCL